MEAQFARYKAGILDEEVWQLRRGYAKAILDNPGIREGMAAAGTKQKETLPN